ncbi:MAG: hypothetical protein Q9213_002767 [Squamulea squamosa]
MDNLANLTPQELQKLLNGPALAPPPGVVPQLSHPPDLWTTGIAVQTLIVNAIALGWAVYVGYYVPSWLASGVAAGVHQWDLRLKYLSPFLYYIHVGSVMYGVCIFFVKWSILLQYLQIFVPLKKKSTMYLASHALIWTNFVFYFVSTFVEIFACSPVRKAWDPLIPEGHCINILALNVAASTINSTSDIGILILPQVSIWRLQMSRKRKIQISGIFLVGIFACVASIVRLGYASKLYTHEDITYYSWVTGVWTHPEMAAGIIVACLPVSPKFFQGLQQTRFFSQIDFSLQSLLRSTNRKRTKGRSVSHQISPGGTVGQGKAWPKSYELLSDKQKLGSGKTNGTNNISTDGSQKEHTLQVPEACILRTVDLDATTASRTQSYTDDGVRDGRVWTGGSLYNVNIMA